MTISEKGHKLMEKLLLTPEEAAETLSIGRTRIYELMALGVLGSVQIGKSRRVPMASVHEFVERLRQVETVDDRTLRT